MNRKIIGSLEEWDSIINYYRPHGSSKTWGLRELKKIIIPPMWGHWNMFSEQNELLDKSIIQTLVTPHFLADIITYLPIEQINGINHLYIMNIFAPSFFVDNESVGFKCISEKYKIDIKEGRCKIVMFLLSEGYSGSKGNRDLEIIEKWRIQEGFSENSIYYITANLIIDELCKSKGVGFTGFPIHVFEPWIWGANEKNNDPPVEYTPIGKNSLFLSYNRMPRTHRIIFVHDLIKNDLFNDGLISLNSVDGNWNNVNIDQGIIDFMKTNTPFRITEKYDLNYNLACNLTLSDYKRTFISVISETLVLDDCLFLSEKIWKPIIVGHPFMVHGGKNTLKYLKGLGYKTFDKWIDESYDSEPDSSKRGNMIIYELVKLKKLSEEDRRRMRIEMYPICEHNKKRFIYLFENNYGEGVLHRKLKNYLFSLWDELNNDGTKKLI